MSRRNPRAGVEDRWHHADGQPTTRCDVGKRWRARYVVEGREHSKMFDRKADAGRAGLRSGERRPH